MRRSVRRSGDCCGETRKEDGNMGGTNQSGRRSLADLVAKEEG